ncbi:type II secretion system F family protein [Corynebacterium sp. p3-SID1145]|uniref:type II secretion system F family protein n=1 Tax=unclassified Corynebacterium TaxID=2624378 RepID=UPI0021AA59C5|nr:MULTISPECIES: type II secretion system F family protein [unclassified Corynebacterium]MCT1451636.1 type II secretion system F family protein [Corynebacterium sp. p3-SID1145]MCT1460733.1 type II secretion system F family protein [Corynebacterium sp. p3-SID1140]
MTGFATAVLLGAALALPPAPVAGRFTPPAGGRGAAGSKTPRDGPPDRHRIASDIELFAACFRAGLPVAVAAEAVADSYGAPGAPGEDAASPLAEKWRRVVAFHHLGVEPECAWSAMDGVPGCGELASLVALSHASGSAVADGCDRLAATLREEAADDATAAAERAGVLISIPLAAFFLPAFFVLGLAPVVIGLGSQMFGGQ